MPLRLAPVLFLLSVVTATSADAHVRSESFSRWQYSDQQLSMRFTVSARDVSRIPRMAHDFDPGQVLIQYLAPRVVVHSPEGGCRLENGFTRLRTRAGFVQAEAVWNCSALPAALEIQAFFDLAAEHSHYASFATPPEMRQHLFIRDQPVWSLDAGAGDAKESQNTFAAFLALGFKHITSGYDHVIFLLALLLVFKRPRDLFWMITGFTLGHSMTLSVVALGLADPNTQAIEATIGLTIALVAVERGSALTGSAVPLAIVCAALLLLMLSMSGGPEAVLIPEVVAGLALFVFCYLLIARDLGDKGEFRILLTGLFGLIHGFGFAGAFLAANMDSGTLFLPLAGFNLGVELGQIVLLAFMLIAAQLLTRARINLSSVKDFAMMLVCGLGVFWFVQRGLT